jgi:hypothetical protein
MINLQNQTLKKILLNQFPFILILFYNLNHLFNKLILFFNSFYNDFFNIFLILLYFLYNILFCYFKHIIVYIYLLLYFYN